MNNVFSCDYSFLQALRLFVDVKRVVVVVLVFEDLQ